MLGCVVGGAGTGLWVKFDFGSARSTVVRDRPDLGYRLNAKYFLGDRFCLLFFAWQDFDSHNSERCW